MRKLLRQGAGKLAFELLKVELAEVNVDHHQQRERRKWDRLPISVPFFIRVDKGNGEELLEFATALNLSAGGALLAGRRYLDPGTSVKLEVPVSLVNKAQLPRSVSVLRARLLRCIPDRQYFLLGFEFETPLLDELARPRLQ